MKNHELHKWCNTATARIRYGPDRESVKAELLAHLEDHYDTLIDKGLSPEEAEKKALTAMGDAKEIAAQLSKIHRPFWGYAYSVLVWITIITVLISLTILPGGLMQQIRFSSAPEDFTQSDTHYYECVFYSEPGDRISCDDYTLHIQKTVLWKPRYGETTGKYYAAIQIRVTRWPTMPKFDAIDYFWAEDNLGTVYVSYADMTYRDGEPFVIPSGPDAGLLTETYYLRIRDIPGPDVKWIDLHYDRDGRDVVLRIELTGGDIT